MLEHPPYSPNLAPSDLFLFPKIKEILTGSYFACTDNIRCNTTAALKAIPQKQIQNILKSGLGAGISVQLPKGSISKAVTVGSLRKS
jgi:hypothetical protein